MKIIQFMDMHSTKYGALEKFFVELMRNDSENQYFFVFQSFPKSVEMVNDFEACGATIIVIDTEGKKAILRTPSVIKLFLKIKPDIVHFHFANAFFIYAIIAKLLGVKKLYKTQHCCIITDDLQQVTHKSQLSLKTKIVSANGLVYNVFDRIIMCSKYIYDQFEQLYGKSEKYNLVYLGVPSVKLLSEDEKKDLKRKLKIEDGIKIISCIAFSHPIKGCDILIKALSFIQYADYRLLLIGLNEEFNYTKELHALAKALGVENHVIWAGITNNVGQYLSISDIYCQPSRSEALSLAACEAKSAHLPIVGSKVGGLPEISNLLYENGNEKELADALSLLLCNADYCAKLADESYAYYLRYFDLKQGIAKYSQLYI